MVLINNIYDILPRVGQTLMLNAYGLKNHRRMLGYNRILSGIVSSEHWKTKRQIDYVSRRLRIILSHAINSVPRYKCLKHLLKPLNDPESDVFSILREFPIITRSEILSEPISFQSQVFKSRRIIKSKTSGTTGTPFTTLMDSKTFNLDKALGFRRNLWAGYKKGDWVARLVGDPVVPLKCHDEKRPWRISWTDKRLYLSTFHLNRETARSYLNVMEEKQPAFLMGYPSSLQILAAYAIEEDRKLTWRPRAIFYSSEPMYEHQRDMILRVFRAPIRGFYGSAERIISAVECEHGSYHLSMVDGYVEGQFSILPQGVPSLMTTLVNRVMPLIRFRLGDVIRLSSNKKCSCGRTLPVIEPVVTKEEDWIETPNGRRVSSSALTWAFKDIKGIRCSQIIQVWKDKVEVHLDTDKEKFEQIVPLLKINLDKMLFGEMEIECIRNNNIKITKAGKTRFVIRKI